MLIGFSSPELQENQGLVSAASYGVREIRATGRYSILQLTNTSRSLMLELRKQNPY